MFHALYFLGLLLLAAGGMLAAGEHAQAWPVLGILLSALGLESSLATFFLSKNAPGFLRRAGPQLVVVLSILLLVGGTLQVVVNRGLEPTEAGAVSMGYRNWAAAMALLGLINLVIYLNWIAPRIRAS